MMYLRSFASLWARGCRSEVRFIWRMDCNHLAIQLISLDITAIHELFHLSIPIGFNIRFTLFGLSPVEQCVSGLLNYAIKIHLKEVLHLFLKYNFMRASSNYFFAFLNTFILLSKCACGSPLRFCCRVDVWTLWLRNVGWGDQCPITCTLDPVLLNLFHSVDLKGLGLCFDLEKTRELHQDIIILIQRDLISVDETHILVLSDDFPKLLGISDIVSVPTGLRCGDTLFDLGNLLSSLCIIFWFFLSYWNHDLADIRIPILQPMIIHPI